MYRLLKSYSQPILCEGWVWTTNSIIFRKFSKRSFLETVDDMDPPCNIVTSDATFEENLFLTRRNIEYWHIVTYHIRCYLWGESVLGNIEYWNIVTCHIRFYLWGECFLGSTDICLGPEGGRGGLCGRWLRRKYFWGNIDHLERQYCL